MRNEAEKHLWPKHLDEVSLIGARLVVRYETLIHRGIITKMVGKFMQGSAVFNIKDCEEVRAQNFDVANDTEWKPARPNPRIEYVTYKPERGDGAVLLKDGTIRLRGVRLVDFVPPESNPFVFPEPLFE